MPIVPLPQFEEEGKFPASAEIRELADEILLLNFYEVQELLQLMDETFDLEDVRVEEKPEKEEKQSLLDVKLTGFDSKSKIKVIKEIRAITSMGLKEAKELVESAPKVVKKDIKKEEAEALKKKIEAVGGQVTIE